MRYGCVNQVIIKSPNANHGSCTGASSSLNTGSEWGEGDLPLHMSPKLTKCDSSRKEWEHKSTLFPGKPGGSSSESSSSKLTDDGSVWWIYSARSPTKAFFPPLAAPIFLKSSWIKQLLSVPLSGFNWCESLTDWWGCSNQYQLEGSWSKRISRPAV